MELVHFVRHHSSRARSAANAIFSVYERDAALPARACVWLGMEQGGKHVAQLAIERSGRAQAPDNCHPSLSVRWVGVLTEINGFWETTVVCDLVAAQEHISPTEIIVYKLGPTISWSLLRRCPVALNVCVAHCPPLGIRMVVDAAGGAETAFRPVGLAAPI